MKKMIFNIGRTLVAAVVLMGAQAFGQTLYTYTVTQTVDFSFSGTGTNSETLTFNNFDDSLGTLTKVNLSLNNVVLSGTVSVQNQGGTTAPYNIELLNQYSLTDNFGNEVDNNKTTYFPGPSSTSTVSLANGATYDPGAVSTAPQSKSTTLSTANGDDLSSYEGDGSQQVDLNLDGQTIATSSQNNGNYLVRSGLSSSGAVVLTYTYTTTTPVETPEPSTWALMIGAGFGAILFVRRRSAVRA